MAPDDLRGFTAAVTADRRRDEQAVLLSRLGLEVLLWPLLRTDPSDEGALRGLTEAMCAQAPDVLLANTGYGMRTWLKLATDWGLADALVTSLQGHTLIGARGAKALGELRKVGLDAKYRAPSETLGELVEWAIHEELSGKTLVLQLHGEGSGQVVSRLEEAGAMVRCAPVYRMGAAGTGPAAELLSALHEGLVDVVTFTAAPQIEALAEAADERGELEQLRQCFNQEGIIAACIGPVCAAAATEIGIQSPVLPQHTRLGSLSTAVAGSLAARQVVAVGRSAEVALSGQWATVQGEQTALRPIERRALRPLCAQAGSWVDLSWWAPARADLAALLSDLAAKLDGALEVNGADARLLRAPAG